MEVLYGIVVLLAFILGLGIGLSVPFFVKKYVETLKANEKTIIVEQKINEQEDDRNKLLPKDLLNEWITGEEAKPNDE